MDDTQFVNFCRIALDEQKFSPAPLFKAALAATETAFQELKQLEEIAAYLESRDYRSLAEQIRAVTNDAVWRKLTIAFGTMGCTL